MRVTSVLDFTRKSFFPQAVRDIVIAGVGISDLQGLENIGTFGNELSIESNPYLTTLRHLGLNLSSDHHTSIRNIDIRNNERLADVDGLRFINRVDGERAHLENSTRMNIYLLLSVLC